jgi:preprotein translocase subunit YajC
MFFADAAPAAAAPAGGGMMSLMPMILVFVVLMLFMSRSQKKQQQKRQAMLDAITKGTPVLLNSGVYGTVVEVKDDCFMVEVADKVCVRINKNGVACVDEKKDGDAKAEK